MNRLVLIILMAFPPAILSSQVQDTTHFPWPNPPFASSHYLNATFCEYRNTLSADHFHSGVDIGEPDGNPIYASLDGVVFSYSTTDGSNNFVRVKTPIGGQWKHISYVHIDPNPGLQVGDNVVAGVTILGTVIAGQGHVHFTERALVASENSSGVEINAVRAGGGLAPFTDDWSPVVDRAHILFREVTTNAFVPSGSLFGNIEFIAKVDERNAPGSVGTTQTNNGTYALGYRILSADSSTVVYEPPDAGVRFQFDRKPLDDYTDNVFLPDPYSNTGAHYYRLTSGLGANDLDVTRTALLGSVDMAQFPEGPHILQIFTNDTHGNSDIAFVSITITHDDLVPPAFPTLSSVLVDQNGTLSISWSGSTDPDLGGYRLKLFSEGVWQTVESETLLTAGTTSISLSSPPVFLSVQDSMNLLALALTAVDTASPPNESSRSDVYAAAYPWFTSASEPSWLLRLQRRILLVDGFDRYGGSGSWASPTHEFAKLISEHLPPLVPVSSCTNEAVISGSVHLDDYFCVFWLLGDESTANRTLTSAEQAKVKTYLEGGGNLFISGSEIGWDLGRTHSLSEPGDLAFYQEYLKASFVYDGTASMSAAQGIAGTLFEGLTVSFGQTYPEDYPDDIQPVNGASPVLIYNATRPDGTPRLAGLAFSGAFGASILPAKLVYIAFPLETIGSVTHRGTLVSRVMQYFDIPTAVETSVGLGPEAFSLSQNYPNPFNPETVVRYEVPASGNVSLRIYDMLGREIASLVDEQKRPGAYTVRWDASAFPTGVYFCRLVAGSFTETRKLVLVR